MPEDPNYTLPLEESPMKYFMEEMYAGNSLRSTTVLANEKERERVYDTIFRLPWRCELSNTTMLVEGSSRGFLQQSFPMLCSLLESPSCNKQISA
ncbi:hypothetical protein CASFOL_018574 [Castilleja foliolosa]|uniref:Uncharacterized protein n=1 Tax=Castilleja foliolosa TaxID=1961234 RepID=A0ABD3D8T3_9LAMI